MLGAGSRQSSLKPLEVVDVRGSSRVIDITPHHSRASRGGPDDVERPSGLIDHCLDGLHFTVRKITEADAVAAAAAADAVWPTGARAPNISPI